MADASDDLWEAALGAVEDYRLADEAVRAAAFAAAKRHGENVLRIFCRRLALPVRFRAPISGILAGHKLVADNWRDGRWWEAALRGRRATGGRRGTAAPRRSPRRAGGVGVWRTLWPLGLARGERAEPGRVYPLAEREPRGPGSSPGSARSIRDAPPTPHVAHRRPPTRHCRKTRAHRDAAGMGRRNAAGMGRRPRARTRARGGASCPTAAA